jgi:hypothetical protein
MPPIDPVWRKRLIMLGITALIVAAILGLFVFDVAGFKKFH